MNLSDGFSRKVEYLRLSVTDRCDFRCVYCMGDNPRFLPKHQVLSLEEMAHVCQAFTEMGVTKIRLTGGEPLMRRDVTQLVARLHQLPGLRELSMTTNGSHLTKLAPTLKAAGLSRLNISLDTLNPVRFQALTRIGKLERVVAGIDAAIDAGFERIKVNAVILKQRNEDEILALVEFCRGRGLDIAFIEEMPLGQMVERESPRYMSSDDVQRVIEQHYPLTLSNRRTGGPCRYFQMPDSDIHIGFISPHSHNFCHECNRVRVTADGRLLLCLGNENSVDLKQVVREYPDDIGLLQQTITESLQRKPRSHHFDQPDSPQILRFMNATGG